MSWSASFPKPVLKSEAPAEIDKLTLTSNDTVSVAEAGRAQLSIAKRVAKSLLDTIPGPFIVVQMFGHANGVGYQSKLGMANDNVSVSVTQFTEADLVNFQ